MLEISNRVLLNFAKFKIRKMLRYLSSYIFLIIILHVSTNVYSEQTCSRKVANIAAVLGTYSKISAPLKDESGELGYGRLSCPDRKINLIRVRTISGLVCDSGSELKFVGMELDELLDFTCNQFESGYRNATYSIVLGDKCYEIKTTEHYEATRLDGKGVAYATGSLEDTVCGGGTYIFFGDSYKNLIGDCRSNDGLKHIESSGFYSIIIGGRCQAKCTGKIVYDFCPAIRS